MPPAKTQPEAAGLTEHDNLTAALAAVQRELPQVSKGEKAEVQTKNGPSYSYRYASLAHLSAAILPLLGRHGLAWACRTEYDEQDRFMLRGQLRHTSGEVQESSWQLPTSGGPQAQGSAITYARRYLLLAATGVAPDDDDDGAAAQAASQQHAPQQARPAAQRGGKGGGARPVCARCGQPLTGAAKRTDDGYVHRGGCPDAPKGVETDTDGEQQPVPEGAVAELYASAGPALARLHQLTGGKEPYPKHYRQLQEDLGGQNPGDGASWARTETPVDVLSASVADLIDEVAELLAERGEA